MSLGGASSAVRAALSKSISANGTHDLRQLRQASRHAPALPSTFATQAFAGRRPRAYPRPAPGSRAVTEAVKIRFQSSSSGASFFQSSDYEDDEGPSQESRKPPRWYQRPVVWVLGTMPIFTFYLGVWQIQRLKWKLELIDELESKLKREPLSLPKNIDLDVLMSSFTNRLFALRGRFPDPTPENTVFLGPRVRDGVRGYNVLQPMERDVGGGQVLVDRGFVAKDKIINSDGDQRTWRLMDTAFDSSQQDHLLLLPRPKERNGFQPDNEIDRHIWYFADVGQLQHYLSGRWAAEKRKAAQGSGADEESDSYTPSHGVAASVKDMLGVGTEPHRSILPIYLEEIFEGNAADAARTIEKGIPIGRAATVELRNQHAVYAATWFSLSAATTVMLAVLLKRGPTGG